ncbi:MAG: protoporphyrinogen oxidase [Verrucomicrobiota bacterium JB022]|nr:protoporphyrinogen oxidase [Verrucomicrobiota bacterium JB022]
MQEPSAGVVIVGAGITGLALALELERQGVSVRILEAADRVGGAIQTVREDGFLYERGPNSLLLRRPEVGQWLESHGLTDRMAAASGAVSKRFLVKSGRIRPMPRSPLSAITTPLYSPTAKLGVTLEPFRAPTDSEDESVASFVSRRLGREFLDYGIAALVNGVYAGDAERLSMRHAFPRVWNLERLGGSLIKGALKLKQQRKAAGEAPYKSRIVSWRGGLEELTGQMAAKLQQPPTLRASLEDIRRDGPGWRIAFAAVGGQRQEIRTRHVVVTTPVHRWAQLPWAAEIAPTVAQVPVPRYAPVATMLLGFRREQVRHPLDGFGVLIPPKEGQRLLGAIFSSTLFAGRAPEGQVALSCFLGGMRHQEVVDLSQTERLRIALDTLKPLLGITGEPTKVMETCWPQAIPQYELGYENLLASVQALEAAQPGLHFLGNFREGPGLYDCLDSARRHAVELAKDAGEHV